MAWSKPSAPRLLFDRFLLGINYPWRIYDGDFGNAGGGVASASSSKEVSDDFAALAQQGVDVVRWFVFGDGGRGITYDMTGRPNGLDPNFIADFQAACDIASKNNIQLVPVLLDYLWLQKAQIQGSVQKGGRSDIITDPNKRHWLITFAFRPIFQQFGCHQAIHSWDVINEPENAIIGGSNQVVGGKTMVGSVEMEPVAWSDMTTFVDAIAEEARKSAPSSLITVGCAAQKFLSNWKGHALDYYQVHFYWEGYPDIAAHDALYNVPANRLGMDKPVVVGEFAVNDQSQQAKPSNIPAFAATLENWYEKGYAGAWPWKFRNLNANDNSSIDDMGSTSADAARGQDMSGARNEINQLLSTPNLTGGGGTARWLLPFEDQPDRGGPWGDNTFIAFRRDRPADGQPQPPRSVNDSLNLTDPWDTGCTATRFVNSYAAMCDIRDAVKKAIGDAKGHVYIAGWRFNPQRDLSDGNSWDLGSWKAAAAAQSDETIIGLVLRMMQAGIKVRILVWLPTVLTALFGGLDPHAVDHYWLAGIINKENDRLNKAHGWADVGVVGLDIRTADNHIAAAHHQKLIVIRAPSVNAAYCGGVDMAFTRREAPSSAAAFQADAFLAGDWQSGDDVPVPTDGWPHQAGVSYDSVDGGQFGPGQSGNGSDLPENVYGNRKQRWHDQHLRLEGPIVATLEDQFRERWRDSSRVFDLDWPGNWRNNQVIFSSKSAFDANKMISDPDQNGAPIPPGASPTIVQMWRTIPYRASRQKATDPFAPFKTRGEFTVMAGVSKAIQASNELVWICDQFFFSRPLARLLNHRLRETSNPDGTAGLGVIVVLPPHADSQPGREHHARELALRELTKCLTPNQRKRVGMYDLWDPADSKGIYCHAKVQTYDGSLMVCGSANMNRRSFTCDTELSLAVLDASVVKQHQLDLWQLFIGTPWPPDIADLDTSGNGAKFIAEFAAAVGKGGTNLITDPFCDVNPVLPNGVPRDRDPGFLFDFIYDHFLEPCSVDLVVEQKISENGVLRDARLDDIVKNMKSKNYWNA